MDVAVPASWVASGYLPQLCARHGTPATHWTKRKFYSRTPLWVFVLIPFSLLIAAIVMAAMRTTVRGQLPACAACTSERRRFVAAVVASWVGWFATLFVAASLSDGWAVIVVLLLAVVALVTSFSGDAFRTRGALSRDKLWVELKGVDRHFADQLNGALRQPAYPVS
jgi:hypothetical protein